MPTWVSLHTGRLLSPQSTAVPSRARGHVQTQEQAARAGEQRSALYTPPLLASHQRYSWQCHQTDESHKNMPFFLFLLLSKWPACPARITAILPCFQDHFRIPLLLYSKNPVNLFSGYSYLGRWVGKNRHQLGRPGFWQVHFAMIPGEGSWLPSLQGWPSSPTGEERFPKS